jgi:hypothetical protein
MVPTQAPAAAAHAPRAGRGGWELVCSRSVGPALGRVDLGVFSSAPGLALTLLIGRAPQVDFCRCGSGLIVATLDAPARPVRGLVHVGPGIQLLNGPVLEGPAPLVGLHWETAADDVPFKSQDLPLWLLSVWRSLG